MKRKYLNVIILCIFLFLNIIFTQYMVHQYYFENYITSIIFCGLNILLFPLALLIYKRDKKRQGV
ncbi:hypothetical protein JOC75_003574 [Metabacillus crassostreae]|uniref:hypothetical protein n=1 Tax=Metabacillus crassostreae TaxID=929098 RepID=UPI001958B857|nr:hypothetical protein [Metabacillus crassostreae]MBM7605551.1 hypothetical protein [Metabacillus crassostreae]